MTTSLLFTLVSSVPNALPAPVSQVNRHLGERECVSTRKLSKYQLSHWAISGLPAVVARVLVCSEKFILSLPCLPRRLAP